MNSIINLFTMKEIIIMASVVVGILLVVLVLTVWDLFARKRNSNLDFEEFEQELNNDEVKENIVVENSIPETPVIEPVKPVITNEVPLIMDVEEPKSIEIKEEQAKVELASITKELENPKSFEDTLSSIEMMEEENAIISYQELLETTKEMNIVLSDSGDEPISITEVYNTYEMNQMVEEENNESVFVSPITDYSKENLAEIQLENTANLEKLDKEMRKTNEFLNILNELKKNLE